MQHLLNVAAVAAIVLALAAFVGGLVSYNRMMDTLNPAVAQMHARRLRIRQSLLFLTMPELFVGAGERYRKWYVAAVLTFIGCCAATAVIASLQPA
jgi:hypothetical protein